MTCFLRDDCSKRAVGKPGPGGCSGLNAAGGLPRLGAIRMPAMPPRAVALTWKDAMLPRFLIIGAMKAGTTTLHDELIQVPGLWLTPEKEPNDLAFAEVETPRGLAVYTRKFDGCPADAIAGEASTAYTKRPTHEAVAARARRVLGPDVRIIYLTRHPIRRIVSQYHHLWGLQLETRPLNRAVLEDETYIAYSRYDWQLAPWRAAFGDDRVLCVRFEDFLADREAEFARICRFIGVPDRVRPEGKHRNASEGALVPIKGTIMERISTSWFYLYQIKPLLPRGLRDRIRALVLPVARPMTETLDAETHRALLAALADDPIAASYLVTR